MNTMRRMSMKLEAQEKMIQALLAAQTTEHEAKADPPPWWDHSAQREPLLVKMSWEQIAINITEQAAAAAAATAAASFEVYNCHENHLLHLNLGAGVNRDAPQG